MKTFALLILAGSSLVACAQPGPHRGYPVYDPVDMSRYETDRRLMEADRLIQDSRRSSYNNRPHYRPSYPNPTQTNPGYGLDPRGTRWQLDVQIQGR